MFREIFENNDNDNEIDEGCVKELEKPEYDNFKKDFIVLKKSFWDLQGFISVTPTLKTLKDEYFSLLKSFEKFNNKFSIEKDIK